MQLLPLLSVLVSASAYALNWGKGGNPFNDGTDSAPVPSSWQTGLNVTIDCPKWSRVSTIVDRTVLLICVPVGNDERGSIRRYSLEDRSELARLDSRSGSGAGTPSPTQARAALQSLGGSFWFRMASNGASLVTPSGNANTARCQGATPPERPHTGAEGEAEYHGRPCRLG